MLKTPKAKNRTPQLSMFPGCSGEVPLPTFLCCAQGDSFLFRSLMPFCGLQWLCGVVLCSSSMEPKIALLCYMRAVMRSANNQNGASLASVNVALCDKKSKIKYTQEKIYIVSMRGGLLSTLESHATRQAQLAASWLKKASCQLVAKGV